jgi:hypothetical protein
MALNPIDAIHRLSQAVQTQNYYDFYNTLASEDLAVIIDASLFTISQRELNIDIFHPEEQPAFLSRFVQLA